MPAASLPVDSDDEAYGSDLNDDDSGNAGMTSSKETRDGGIDRVSSTSTEQTQNIDFAELSARHFQRG